MHMFALILTLFLTPADIHISSNEKGVEASILVEFHETARYEGNPEAFWTKRIAALEKLSQAATSEDLKRRIKNKLTYIREIRTIDIQKKLDEFGMKPRYWPEYIDPLHRCGKEIKVYIDYWVASEIPDYLLFLETVESDPLFEEISDQILYKETDEEREEYKAGFGELEGTYDYVVSLEGEFYIFKEEKYKVHHSTLFAGKAVLSAGEIEAQNGSIVSISNKSGHYQPSVPAMLKTLALLEKQGVNLQGVEVQLIQQDKEGNKYFDHVAWFNAKEFLENGGEAPAIRATGDWTPLHVAVWNNHLSLSSLEDANVKDSRGNTPLDLAIRQDHTEWIERLMATMTLDKAAAGSVEGFLTLFDRLEDPNIFDKNSAGESLLRIAAKSGKPEMIALLQQLGLPLAEVNAEGQTLLHTAAIAGNGPCFRSLLSSLDANQKDIHGKTPLHYAITTLSALDLKEAIRLGAEVEDSMLFDAVESESFQNLVFLLSVGADPEVQNHEGLTPLELAIKMKSKGAILRLRVAQN